VLWLASAGLASKKLALRGLIPYARNGVYKKLCRSYFTSWPVQVCEATKSKRIFKPDGGYEFKGFQDFSGYWRFDEGKMPTVSTCARRKTGRKPATPYSTSRKGTIISTTILGEAFTHTPGYLPEQSE
jgi:hypothetical protein